MCTGYGGYANDGINMAGRQDLWNAEFVLDPDDLKQETILLRATREILPGEQIFVWYGPEYWCDDDYPVELLYMAVIAYGVN